MSQSPHTEDAAELAVAAQSGDPNAIDAWYRHEHPQVYRIALGFLTHTAEAQDLAQDAMIHLLDKLSTRKADRPYRSWRIAVVANLARDRRRRLQARTRAEKNEKLQLTERLPRPDDSAQSAELQEILLHSLRALSPREREVFVLHDLEAHSHKDIAQALGIKSNTCRTLLTLARRRLRSLLGPHLAMEGPSQPGDRRG